MLLVTMDVHTSVGRVPASVFCFFFPQICEVGGLAIMHRRSSPNLAGGRRIFFADRDLKKEVFCYNLVLCGL